MHYQKVTCSCRTLLSCMLVSLGLLILQLPVFASDPVTVIVKMKGAPVNLRSRAMSTAGARSALDAMKQSHMNVILKLLNMQKSGTHTSALAANAFIKYDYCRVLNGFAARIPAESVDALRRDPDVEAVCPDSPVKALWLTDRWFLQTHVDDVWLRGYYGTGVTVAVLDTGIDYTHPSLGGGIGPGHTVIGGYNFTNNTIDCMDHHGHGTAVAGMVAANSVNGSGVQGVAFGAKLLAYKVLDDNGSGITSVILAGLERALDPDQDPATDDAADIVLMSFGNSDCNDQIMNDAIENATKAGALCVASAGNDGYDKAFSSVSSPASAPSALGVGSVDGSDNPSSFSSRGPSKCLLLPKPDCLAPGEGITVCKPGGGYDATYIGTSISAAYAAGVAALLKSAHPTWGPDVLKAAIMQGAADLNQPYVCQGTGRIDALKSLDASAVIAPASLGLGLDIGVTPEWRQERTLTIRNLSLASQTYQLTTWADCPGVTMTISPSQVTVPANGSQSVILTVSVDNASVPDLPSAPYVRQCKLVATSAAGSITVPIIFVKTTRAVSGTAGKCKTSDLGATVTLTGKCVTSATWGSCYVEEMDRSSGILVYSPVTLKEGDIVDVSGVLSADSYEPRINADYVSVVGSAPVPAPLAMGTRAVGGGRLGQQPAVQEWLTQPGTGVRTLCDAIGPNNVGLLVTTWGKITRDDNWPFYISDGSIFDDGNPAVPGVRVNYTCPGKIGDYVRVTGISTCQYSNDGHLYRMICPRRSEDIIGLKMY